MHWRLRHERRTLVLCLFSVALVGICACSPSSPEISIQDAWSFPSNQGQAVHRLNVAVYVTIQNQGRLADRIIGAQSSIADTVEIHQSSIDEKGIMRMRAQSDVRVPAKQDIVFKPGGRHFMLVNVSEPLELGKTFQIRLLFAESGEIEATVNVSNR